MNRPSELRSASTTAWSIVVVSTYPTSVSAFRSRSAITIVGDCSTSTPRAMRPYFEICLSGATCTATRPSQRSMSLTAERTALSSADLPFQKRRTRTLSLRIARATGFGRPLRSPAIAAAAPVAAGAVAVLVPVPVAAVSPGSTPSTLSCWASWPLAASTAPSAASLTLPGSLTAPCWVAAGVVAGGMTSSLGRRKSM